MVLRKRVIIISDLLSDLYRLAHPNLPAVSTDNDGFYWSYAWRKLSKEILERDHHECQACRDQGKVTLRDGKLIVHHIKPIEFYPDLRLDPTNLITVCLRCHNYIHHGKQARRWDDEWWG